MTEVTEAMKQAGWDAESAWDRCPPANPSRVEATYLAMEAARIPAPAPDVVERVARALYEAQFERGTTWDDWEAYLLRSDANGFDGRDECRRLSRAALSAIPIPAPTGEVERETAIRAWSAGARAVHDEWAKADEGERFYLSRDHEPDFTEVAHDYAAALTDHTTKDDE